jgi:hypothetical protein
MNNGVRRIRVRVMRLGMVKRAWERCGEAMIEF